MRTKLAILAGGILIASTMAGSAADIPAPVYKAPAVAPVYDWSGFYIGVQGGWAGAEFDHTFNIAGHYNLNAGDTLDYGKSGGILGGQIGYNWQAGAWVFGAEASLAKTWLSQNQVSPFFPATDTWRSEVEWIGTVTGRIGYAWNNVLGYAKGGWAVARLNDYVQDTVDFVDVSRTRSGWTLGGGVEWAFAPNWTLGIEYNYFEFNTNITESSTLLGGGGTFFPGTDHDLDVRVQSVIAKLSYKWNWSKAPVIAKY